jgi:hypothetical protein
LSLLRRHHRRIIGHLVVWVRVGRAVVEAVQPVEAVQGAGLFLHQCHLQAEDYSGAAARKASPAHQATAPRHLDQGAIAAPRPQAEPVDLPEEGAAAVEPNQYPP